MKIGFKTTGRPQNNVEFELTQQTFTSSKSAIEELENGVKYVES